MTNYSTKQEVDYNGNRIIKELSKLNKGLYYYPKFSMTNVEI